jgi:hypothetical protein
MAVGENLSLTPTAIVLDPPSWQVIETFAGAMPNAEWLGDLDKFSLDFSEGYLQMLPTPQTGSPRGESIYTALPQEVEFGVFTVTFDFLINGPSTSRSDVSFAAVGSAQLESSDNWVRRGGNTRLGTFGATPQAFRAFAPPSTIAIPGAEVQEQWYHAWIVYNLAQQRIDFHYAPFGDPAPSGTPAASWSFDPQVDYSNFTHFIVGLDRPTSTGLRLGNLYFAADELLTLSPTAGIFFPSAETFVRQPVDAAVVVGSAAEFSAELADPDNWDLRWEVSFDEGNSFSNLSDNLLFVGATTATLFIPDVSSFLNGLRFRLRATAETGEIQYSDTVILTAITTPPVITFSAEPVVVESGDPAFFSALVSGGAVMRWERSVDDGISFEELPDQFPFTGASGSALLMIEEASMDFYGHLFRLRATNEAGTTISDAARLTVLPRSGPPVLVTHPINQSVRAGDEAHFEVEVSGNPAPSVRWQLSFDGAMSFSDLAENALGVFTGTETTRLTVGPANSFLDGVYLRVRAFNGLGQAFSLPARLTLSAHPTLAEWALDQGLAPEQSAPGFRHAESGLTTLEAFAFGLNPTEAVLPSELPTLHREGNELLFRYRRNTAVEGLSFVIQSSSNLVEWATAAGADQLLFHDGDNIEVRESAFIDDGQPRFLRLRLEITE